MTEQVQVHQYNNLTKQPVLSITGTKPLVYRHPLNHLVTAIPYVDSESNVPKSVITYLLKTEMELLRETGEKQKDYLAEFPMPATPFMDSEHHQAEVQRVLAKKENKEKKTKKNPTTIPEVSIHSSNPEDVKLINEGRVRHQYAKISEFNTSLGFKLGPLVMKEQMAALDKLKEAIHVQLFNMNREIEEINAKRRYEQLENKERLDTIKDRVKILLAGRSLNPEDTKLGFSATHKKMKMV